MLTNFWYALIGAALTAIAMFLFAIVLPGFLLWLYEEITYQRERRRFYRELVDIYRREESQ